MDLIPGKVAMPGGYVDGLLNLVLVHLVVSAPVSAIDHGEPVHGGAPSPAPANRSSEGIVPLCRCNCLLRHEIDTCRANHPLCPSGPVVNSLHEFLPPYLLSFRAHRTIRVRRTPCTLTWQGLPSGRIPLIPPLSVPHGSPLGTHCQPIWGTITARPSSGSRGSVRSSPAVPPYPSTSVPWRGSPSVPECSSGPDPSPHRRVRCTTPR